MDSPSSVLEPKSDRALESERAAVPQNSLGRIAKLVRRRWRFCLAVVFGVNLLCLLYCFVASNQYEASAKIALATQPASNLHIDAPEGAIPLSVLNAPLQLETLANEMRSDQLVWRVITGLKLYDSPAFARHFHDQYPSFDPKQPTPLEQSHLIESFGKQLHIGTLPRTLLIQVRFRSRDPVLSASVVTALLQGFTAEEVENRSATIAEQSRWLASQLDVLSKRVIAQEKELAALERKHGFLTSQESVEGGQPMESLHNTSLAAVDEAERQWLAASADRILRETLLNQARQGDPEQVLAANPQLQAEMGPGGAYLAQQLRARRSEFEVELAQLRVEHGPNYSRVVELTKATQEIDQQIKAADQNLVDAFERTWKAAQERETLVRRELDARTNEGLDKNDASMQYTVLHEQVQSGRELGNRLRQRMEEAALSAGIHASAITVVDPPRIPAKPLSPDPPVYLGISLFASMWLAVGGALVADAWFPSAFREVSFKSAVRSRSLMMSFAALVFCVSTALSQAPTPNTQGLPSGVVKLPEDPPVTVRPDPRQSPAVWNGAAPAPALALPEPAQRFIDAGMSLPIAPGYLLEVSEFHLAEFHASLRVAANGTASLPLIGQLALAGLTEQEAAHAIERSLVSQGILLHPQVLVTVIGAAGQDVSVMGEVVRPGIYSYTVHHRLLDLIAAASGLSPNAGRLVSVFHRRDPETPHAVVLDPTGSAGNTKASAAEWMQSPEEATGSQKLASPNPDPAKIASPVNHNPELEPGDTVLISRAGLAYVIGDVVRPGGFPVDPVQGLTVVQAISLAWGATPNASVSKAILIRDQMGGRTLTTLNLHRMIRGEDPDLPIHDRDILFVPNSAAKNLMNKSLEAAIQSAIGVSIYAGLVYSQRF